MKSLRQIFLKPGVYHDGVGRSHLSKELLGRYAKNTKRMLQMGLSVPVLLEHAKPGTKDGSPRDSRADQVKHGVGWLRDIRQLSDGSLQHVLDVTDRNVAKKMKAGSIRFTSPELRNEWQDGQGRVHKKIFAHVALTHKPRNPSQTRFKPVAHAKQFSLADLVEADMPATAKRTQKQATKKRRVRQFAADDEQEDKGGEGGGAGSMGDLIKELAEWGIVLSKDTTPETLLRDLLSGLQTSRATREKLEGDDSDDEEDTQLSEEEENEELREDRSPVQQFSLADVDSPKFTGSKLLTKIIKQESAGLAGRIGTLVTGGRMPQGLADALTKRKKPWQFSADGDLTTRIPLNEVIDLLEKHLPESNLDATQLSTEGHPAGEDFLSGSKDGQMSQKAAEDQAEKLAEKFPHMYKSKRGKK